MVNSEEGVIRFEKHNFGQLEPKQHPKIFLGGLRPPRPTRLARLCASRKGFARSARAQSVVLIRVHVTGSSHIHVALVTLLVTFVLIFHL